MTREEAIKHLKEWKEVITIGRRKEVIDMAIEALSQPKTGKWILDPNGMDWNISAWRCSECGFVATHIGVEPNGLGDSPLNWAGSKFCPQCGTRITGYER